MGMHLLFRDEGSLDPPPSTAGGGWRRATHHSIITFSTETEMHSLDGVMRQDLSSLMKGRGKVVPNSSESARNVFAQQRTHLANERTLLASLRTALGGLALGFIILRFDTSPAVRALGWAGIAAAAVLTLGAVIHYFNVKKKINRIRC
jgi:putative membrane protein